MTGSNPRVSVVLVSFNTRELTLQCLRSLIPVTAGDEYEVVLVDNASTDGTVEAVEYQFPQVEIVSNTVNVGFGPANNIGFRQCRGRYVLLLNTDTIVYAESIPTLVRVLDEMPEIGAVGCRLLNSDGSLQRSCWSFPTPARAWAEALGLHRLGLFEDQHRRDHKQETCVDFVIGAAMMVRKEVIEETDGFDEKFFMYAEEADWQKRMHTIGWRVYFTPNARITHLGGASSSQMRQRQVIESCRGTARYIRKHHGAKGLFLFRLGVVFGLFIRILLATTIGSISRIDRNRWLILRTTMKYWCGLESSDGLREIASAPVLGQGSSQ